MRHTCLRESVNRVKFFGIFTLVCFILFSGVKAETNNDSHLENLDPADRALETGNYEEAINLFTRIIELDNINSVAKFSRGKAYFALGQYNAAAEDFRLALKGSSLYPSSFTSQFRGWLGRAMLRLGHFGEASKIAGKVQLVQPEDFRWLLLSGHVALLSGNEGDARSFYQKAIVLIPNEKVSDSYAVSDFEFFQNQGWCDESCEKVINWFHLRFADSADYRLSRKLLDKAVSLHRAGDENEAVKITKTVISKLQSTGAKNHPWLIEAHYALAAIYPDLEKIAEAEKHLRIAIDSSGKSSNLSSLKLLETMAAQEMMNDHFLQSEAIYIYLLPKYEKKHGVDSLQVKMIQNYLNGVYRSQGDEVRANEIFEPMIDSVPGSEKSAKLLAAKSWIKMSQGDNKAAQELIDQAEKQTENDPLDQLILENQKRELAASNGDDSAATASQFRGIAKAISLEALNKDTTDYSMLFEQGMTTGLLFELAQVRTSQGRFSEAILFGKAAINRKLKLHLERGQWVKKHPDIVENFQQVTKNAYAGQGMQSPDLNVTTQQLSERLYRNIAAWLVEAGRLPEAQLVMSELKQLEYMTFWGDGDDSQISPLPFASFEASWIDKLNTLENVIVQQYQATQALRKKEQVSKALQSSLTNDRLINALGDQYTMTANDMMTIKESDKIIDKKEAEIVELLKSISHAFEQYSNEENTRKSALMPDVISLQDGLRSFGQGTVLLSYIVDQKELKIFLIGSDKQKVVRHQITQSDLYRLIQQFRNVLQDPQFAPEKPAKVLYDLLILPIVSELEEIGTKTILLSLDGALRYIPMAALFDGESYFAEHYALAIYTEANKTKTNNSQVPAKLAALGLSEPLAGFDALPAVPSELEGIVQRDESDNDGVLPGIIRLNKHFDEGSLKQALSNQYPYVHIASHFIFEPAAEQNSFLLLGTGEKLSLIELSADNFSFKGIELLTLSACETALSGTDATGKEMEGFGTMAQRRGAKGVLASLWSVADASTGQFMKKMYEYRQQSALTTAEAVKQTQIAFIRGDHFESGLTAIRGASRQDDIEPASTKTSNSSPYSHPYYWAPFVLMGQ